MTKHSPAPWHVRPDYGQENVYRIWDKNDNYHDDTSPEVMDANAQLIALAPELLAVAKAVLLWAKTPGNHGGNPYGHDFVKRAEAVIDKLKVKG